jgi:hypothetical protein
MAATPKTAVHTAENTVSMVLFKRPPKKVIHKYPPAAHPPAPHKAVQTAVTNTDLLSPCKKVLSRKRSVQNTRKAAKRQIAEMM